MSKTSRYSEHYLVDRGANGDAAGNAVRVIAKHPEKTVDIRGVDNHEITANMLVTAGVVTSTTVDEDILIMHKHANNKNIHS